RPPSAGAAAHGITFAAFAQAGALPSDLTHVGPLAERGEARPRASRARSLLLGALVRRVARRGSGGDNRARARGEGAHLAGNGRLAAARTHQPVHRMPENPHHAVARSARFGTAGLPGSVSAFANATTG